MNALLLYRAATRVLGPVIRLYLGLRLWRGKEDAARFRERLGQTTHARPTGPLIWLHAASVGEAASLLALIDRLGEDHPEANLLVTTGTVSSAGLLAKRLDPKQARHQYVPVDRPGDVRRFLDHWRPDLAIWVESELWPNLMAATQARGIPTILLNGRMSERSFLRWRRWPGLVRPLLSGLAVCLAQDEAQAARFRALGATHAGTVGDLKSAAAPLPVSEQDLAALSAAIGQRPFWLAASTHAGEEEAALAAHAILRERFPELLTIIVPRHPARVGEIAALCTAQGRPLARRSRGEPVAAATEIYLGDTLGEMGLFYRLGQIVFIGGSLAPHGGHNPMEAALLGCAILHGPDMSNCAGMAAALRDGGAARVVENADGLAQEIAALLDSPAERARRSAAAKAVAMKDNGVLDRVLERMAGCLEPILAEPTPRLERDGRGRAYA